MLPILETLLERQVQIAAEKRDERKRIDTQKRVAVLQARLADARAGVLITVVADGAAVRGRKKAPEPVTVDEIEAELAVLRGAAAPGTDAMQLGE